MKLTKTSTQAALALAFLAEQPATQATRARQVAEHLNVPTDSALKVLQTLVRQKLLQSQLGRAGGYRLELEPHRISLLRVIEAIEGPLEPQMPIIPAAQEIDASFNALRETWERAVRRMRDALSTTTIADLMQADNQTAIVHTLAG